MSYSFSQINDPSWINLIPNYSFEEVTSNYPNNPINNDFTCPVGPYSAMVDYWSEIIEWTFPLRRLCGRPLSPDVLTFGNTAWGYGYNIPSRSGIRYGHGTTSEYLVVPTKEPLSPNKMYFVECFSGNTGKNILIGNQQPKQCHNFGAKLKGGPFQLVMNLKSLSVNDLGNDYVRSRTYFSPVFEGGWITIGSESGGGNVEDFRIYEVQENGCRDNWYFDNTVFNYPFEFFQASDKIYVGNGVDPESGVNHIPGDVIIYAGTEVVLQAGNQVIIDDGFFMEEGGSKLIIENKPCNDGLCPEELTFDNEILCDISSLQIGTSPNSWGTSVTWSPSIHLDNPNVANPTFTSPGGTGTVQYTVQVTYTCDGSFQYTSSYPVTVQYSDSDDPNATISVIDTEWDVYNFSAEFEVGEGVTDITISLNSFIESYEETFYAGDDFNCCDFNWELPEAWKWSSCHDDVIIVSARNGCSEVIQEITLNWPKTVIPFQPPPQLPNVITPNGDGVNEELWITVPSADYYFISVQNRWGNQIIEIFEEGYGEVKDEKLVIFSPSPYQYTDGVYFYEIEYWDLCGNFYEANQFFHLVNDNTGMVQNNNSNEANYIEENITNIENDSQDEVLTSTNKALQNINSILIFPNPSDGLINIASQELEIGVVNVFDYKGALIYSKNVNSKSFTVDISSKAKGVYWVEVQTKEGVKRQKVSVI